MRSLPFKGVREVAREPKVRDFPNANRLGLLAGRAGVGMVSLRAIWIEENRNNRAARRIEARKRDTALGCPQIDAEADRRLATLAQAVEQAEFEVGVVHGGPLVPVGWGRDRGLRWGLSGCDAEKQVSIATRRPYTGTKVARRNSRSGLYAILFVAHRAHQLAYRRFATQESMHEGLELGPKSLTPSLARDAR